MNLALEQAPDPQATLTKAFVNAGRELGMTQSDLGSIIGKDQSTISRRKVSPDSKEGEIALLFIRCYRSLFALNDGDKELMQHWWQTNNLHTRGIPAEQAQTITGLAAITEYLDAIRGKI